MKKYETGYEEVDYKKRNKKNKPKNFRVYISGYTSWHYGEYHDIETANLMKEKLMRSLNLKEIWIEQLVDKNWIKMEQN
jgi:hypothetical protein